MKWGVVRFPGSLDDGDALYALRSVLGQDAAMLWHKDETLGGADCVVLPGGFSYGDYLRCGAIARFSPIMKSVTRFAADGGLVHRHLQWLSDSVRSSSAARRADAQSIALFHLRFHQRARRERANAVYAAPRAPGEILRLPIKHGEGCYVAPAEELAQMEERGQVVLRYVDDAGIESDAANPNGSMRSIAGVANDRFNVFGLMPHPEHAVEKMVGGDDGLKIFQSIIEGAR